MRGSIAVMKQGGGSQVPDSSQTPTAPRAHSSSSPPGDARGAIARTAAAAFLLSRLLTAVFVYLGHLSHPYLEKIPGGYSGVPNWWLNPWTTFDSLHFLQIAAHGYTPENTVFFPLYPFLLRLFAPAPVAMALWGVLFSNACLLISLFLFGWIVLQQYDATTAQRAIWLLAFYPSTAFASAVYTESVFLVLLLGTFLALRKNSVVVAGVLAAGAALTRNSGPVLALALLAEALRRRRAGENFWVPLAAAIPPVLSFVTVQEYFSRRFGGLVGVASQKHYFRAWGSPLTPLWRDFRDILTGRHDDITTILNFAATLVAIWCAVWLWRRGQLAEAVLIGGIMTMQLTMGHSIPPYTIASLRYMMTTFPFVAALAYWVAPLYQRPLSRAMFWVLYGSTGALLSVLFGLKIFEG